MNNKITTNETMTKIADATRIRTRQLLRFSEGYKELFTSFVLLTMSGAFLSLTKLPAKWALVVFAVCVVLSIAGIVIFASIRKKQLPLMQAEAYRRLNARRKRFLIAFTIFYIIGVSVLVQIAPFFYKNYFSLSFPQKYILTFVFLLVILNFYSFLETHLSEYLIASIVCLGISVASVVWPFRANLLVALFISAFIQIILGSILWIRWRRITRQISDESREGKEV